VNAQTVGNRCSSMQGVERRVVYEAPWPCKIRVLSPNDCTMRALSPRKRTAAVLQMARDAGKAQEALDAVRDGLYHHHWLARWRAIQVLRDTVPRGDVDAVRELVRLCRDPTPEVRVAAPEALEKVPARA
jgi:HEAT repeat protein